MKPVIILLLIAIQFSLACGFAQSALQSAGYTIRDNQASVVVPFDLIDNRIFVNVEINGQGPFRFILDSGAGNLVTPEVAARLNLKKEDSFTAYGVGEQSVEAWRTTVTQIKVGGVQATNQRFTVLSLEPVKQAIGFERLDGLIGSQLFNSLIAKVDYEQSRVTFIQPSKFSYQGSGVAVPFEFDGHIPQVDAEVDGFRGKLKIDTGDRSSLTLYVPFVENNKLREKYAPPFKTITGWGIGGRVLAQVTRAKTIKFGGAEIQNVVTRLPIAKSGAYMDADVIGSVGTGLLKRFNVIFDYSRKRLIFEKNKNFSDPDVYDRAGMWLSQSDDAFEVLDVVAGSPAEKSGIKTGDKILAVNGKSSSELVLTKVRLMLKRTDTKDPVKLTLLSGENRREALISLENIV